MLTMFRAQVPKIPTVMVPLPARATASRSGESATRRAPSAHRRVDGSVA
jgi:hypothetical protein